MVSRCTVRCVAFKPDNPNILVSCSDDATIKMWDITSGSILSTLSCERYDTSRCTIALDVATLLQNAFVTLNQAN